MVTKARKEECAVKLRELLPPGATVWTTCAHVSRSGMFRKIECFVMQDNEPRRISSWVADLLGLGYDDKAGAVRVSGCGMDMGFHIVYNLSHALNPSGFDCIGYEGVSEYAKRCPSNDHSNREKPPEGSCEGPNCRNLDCKPWRHGEGGYALRHRWL